MEMTRTKCIDRRIVKTRKAIKAAFMEIMCRKEISAITVKEIAELANINRKTFYLHYASVREILDDIENEIIATLVSLIKDDEFAKNIQNPYILFSKINELINKNLEFFKHLMGTAPSLVLLRKISDEVEALTLDALCHDSDIEREELEIALEYSFAGILAVYRRWFNSGRRESLQEISEKIGIIAFKGINGIVGNAQNNEKGGTTQRLDS